MTQTGSPYDNAVAESVNGIQKIEFNLYTTFESYNQANESVDQRNSKIKPNTRYVNNYQEENITL